MNQVSVNRFAPAALMTLMTLGGFLAGSPVQAQTETEPNSSCFSAQNLGGASLPITVTGSLDTPPGTPDVDFYRFTGTPDELIVIDQKGSASGAGTLDDPYVGFFSSSCNLLAYADTDSSTGNWLDARLEVRVPADGIFVVAASSAYDWDFAGLGDGPGSYTLSVRKVAVAQAIGGRLVNARTGAPVAGASIDLVRCEGGFCSSTSGTTYTGEDGLFRFDRESGTVWDPVLRAGEYRLVFYPPQGYQSLQTPLFEVAEGQDLSLGDLEMSPLAIVGSIRGRLVDAQTAVPLSSGSALYALVELQACPVVSSCYTVTNLALDPQGGFLIQSGDFGPLLAGTYRLRAHVDQYYVADSEPFEVADGQHYDFGDFAVKSFPVRLTLARGCGPIPSEGGECRFDVRISNATANRLEADSWSLVRAIGVFFPGEVTQFQAGARKTVKVAPGASVTLPYTIEVPAALPDGTTICARAYAAEKKNPFVAIAIHDVFCLRKGEQGFTALSEEDRREVLKQEKKKD